MSEHFLRKFSSSSRESDKKAYSNKKLHYQPFFVNSVSLSKCNHFRYRAKQKTSVKTWRTDRKKPLQQMKPVCSSKKDVKEKLYQNVVLFLNNNWRQSTTHVCVLQIYFYFLSLFARNLLFPPAGPKSSRCFKRLLKTIKS